MGTALITGASSGLGLEFAWQLATAHHNVVLVARDKKRLQEQAAKIASAAGVRTEVIQADLGNRDDVERVAERLRDTTQRVGLLVNNAGYSLPTPFLMSEIADEETMIDVMIKALMVLSRAAADTMVEHGRGAILNISSVAAYTTSGTYSAAKAWVKVFTEGLAGELRGTGVTATAVLPGLTHTEFHQRAQLDYDAVPEVAWLTAEQVVSQSLAAVRRGAVLCTPSMRYASAGQLARVLPRAVIRAVSR